MYCIIMRMNILLLSLLPLLLPLLLLLTANSSLYSVVEAISPTTISSDIIFDSTSFSTLMHDKIIQDNGLSSCDSDSDNNNDGRFIAALDQSGGSTPKALLAYGMNPSIDNYEDGTDSMYDAVHTMRTRIITSPSFTSDKILGAILFEDTMNRKINGVPTCQYLWKQKGIVPFLKIDRGLLPPTSTTADDGDDSSDNVQLMKPIPELELKQLLQHARSEGMYGTKARSLILSAASAANANANANNIDSDDNSSNDGVDQNQNHQNIIQLVKQQFDLARLVLKEGLIPIIEPEIDINCPNKQLCEEILVKALLDELNLLMVEDDDDDDDESQSQSQQQQQQQLSLDNKKQKQNQVIIKITIPEKSNQYLQVINHPCCLRVIALSGGYTQQKACRKLYQNKNLIASFSRAFTIDLKHTMTNTEFDESLLNNINIIYNASCNDKSIESY